MLSRAAARTGNFRKNENKKYIKNNIERLIKYQHKNWRNGDYNKIKRLEEFR